MGEFGQTLPIDDDAEHVVAVTQKPRIWTVFSAIGVSMIGAAVFQMIAGTVLFAIEVAAGTDIRDVADQNENMMATPTMFFLMAACAQLAMGLTVLGAAWRSPVPMRERLGLLPANASWTIYPLTMLGSLVPLAIGFAFAIGLAQVLPADPSVEALLDNLTLGQWVPFILFIAIVPGVVEELLYRGYVQRRLLKRWRPRWAIGVTSVLFALMHVMPHAIVATLPLGVWLGVVAWRTGSILPSMGCHAFINGSVNAWRMAVKYGDISEAVQLVSIAMFLIAGCVCFVVCLRRFAGSEAASSCRDT
jgi:membrane protease YdiL (CAAX protease family)